MGFAIQTHNLSKRFPQPRRLGRLALPFARQEGTLAVDRVSIEVERGEIFGLVGPNGAGKTTLVNILTTLVLPTSGTARVNGYDLSEEEQIKASIGLVTGNERTFYPRLSCRENLRFYAGLHNLSPSQTEQRIAELSHLLGLGEFLDKRFDVCSTGMKHRLALARGLLNEPKVLFLDEPTKSLDPLAAARFRETLYALAHQERCTVFLVTHDLNEAAELCERVGVMLQGRLRVVDTLERLRSLTRSRHKCCVEVLSFTPQVADRLLKLDGVLDVAERERVAGVICVELYLQDRRQCLWSVIQTIEQSGGAIKALEFEEVSWEEVFQNLTTEEASAADQEAALALAEKTATLTSNPSPGGSEDEGLPVASLSFAHPRRETREGILSSRPGIVGAFYKPLLFLRRDLLTETSYRLSFILELLGILFSTATFYFVAQLFGAGAGPYLSNYGGDYFAFVLIGIAFVSYQAVALYTFSGIVQSAQVTGTLEAMFVTPTHLPTILFGSSLWNFVFTSLRVVLYLLGGVTVFGVNLRHANVLAAFVILCLTILTLSGIGILSACFILVFKRGNPINFLIGSLSTLLAGVYYPVEVLPPWIQTLARLFPLTYSLAAMRRALLMGDSLATLKPEVAVLAGFSAVVLPLSLLAFRLAVRQAKRDGSLTQF